jgi:hypothetical protein
MSPRKPRRELLSRRSASLARRVGGQAIKKTVVVVCEGTRTEPQYLQWLGLQKDVAEVAAVRLIVERGSKGQVPLQLVQRAVDLKDRAAKENGEVDEVWCVFDVEWPERRQNEHHPHLGEALQLALNNDVHVAISNPCFEVWLILHFRELAGFVNNGQARKMRQVCDGQESKNFDGLSYEGKHLDALRRAARLDAKHKGDGTEFPHNNPSSGMHLLLSSVT